MLEKNNCYPSISHIQKSRMRYRGPIESYKINAFKQDINKDIIELNKQLSECNINLNQYATETFIESEQTVAICNNGEQLFECNDNKTMDKILPRRSINE